MTYEGSQARRGRDDRNDKLNASQEAGKVEEFDRSDIRWDHFQDTFREYDDIPPEMFAIWFESDLRRQLLKDLEEWLDGDLEPPFDDENLIKGLKLSLGFFSHAQLQELQRFTDKVGEGLAALEDQEHFEKSSKSEIDE
jgi:hypothetical protein